MYNIRFIPKEQIDTILPFLKMLDSKMDDELLRERLDAMKDSNYQCVGVFKGEKLVGISGLWTLNKYYVGKHVEPDNVIIHPDYRGQKLGEQLMDWIHNYAKEVGCTASELNCYVVNHKGTAFWMKQGYYILGYHMRKDL